MSERLGFSATGGSQYVWPDVLQAVAKGKAGTPQPSGKLAGEIAHAMGKQRCLTASAGGR